MDLVMGYIALMILSIIVQIILVILAGMLLVGLGFVVYAIVKYFKNGRQFIKATKNKLILGIGLATIPLLLLGLVGKIKINENVRNSRDLYYQATSGTVEGMREILESGVPADCKAFDLSLKTNAAAEGTETTILGYLVIHYNDQHNERDQYGEKIQLLIDYGADVNRKMGYISMPDKIATPLLMAFEHRNSNVIELLLKNGADVNARYPDGETALQKINKDIENYGPDGYRYDEDLYNKFLKIRALLLKYGAK